MSSLYFVTWYSVHLDCRFRPQGCGWKSSVRLEPRTQFLFILKILICSTAKSWNPLSVPMIDLPSDYLAKRGAKARYSLQPEMLQTPSPKDSPRHSPVQSYKFEHKKYTMKRAASEDHSCRYGPAPTLAAKNCTRRESVGDFRSAYFGKSDDTYRRSLHGRNSVKFLLSLFISINVSVSHELKWNVNHQFLTCDRVFVTFQSVLLVFCFYISFLLSSCDTEISWSNFCIDRRNRRRNWK